MSSVSTASNHLSADSNNKAFLAQRYEFQTELTKKLPKWSAKQNQRVSTSSDKTTAVAQEKFVQKAFTMLFRGHKEGFFVTKYDKSRAEQLATLIQNHPGAEELLKEILSKNPDPALLRAINDFKATAKTNKVTRNQANLSPASDKEIPNQQGIGSFLMNNAWKIGGVVLATGAFWMLSKSFFGSSTADLSGVNNSSNGVNPSNSTVFNNSQVSKLIGEGANHTTILPPTQKVAIQTNNTFANFTSQSAQATQANEALKAAFASDFKTSPILPIPPKNVARVGKPGHVDASFAQEKAFDVMQDMLKSPTKTQPPQETAAQIPSKPRNVNPKFKVKKPFIPVANSTTSHSTTYSGPQCKLTDAPEGMLAELANFLNIPQFELEKLLKNSKPQEVVVVATSAMLAGMNALNGMRGKGSLKDKAIRSLPAIGMLAGVLYGSWNNVVANHALGWKLTPELLKKLPQGYFHGPINYFMQIGLKSGLLAVPPLVLSGMVLREKAVGQSGKNDPYKTQFANMVKQFWNKNKEFGDERWLADAVITGAKIGTTWYLANLAAPTINNVFKMGIGTPFKCSGHLMMMTAANMGWMRSLQHLQDFKPIDNGLEVSNPRDKQAYDAATQKTYQRLLFASVVTTTIANAIFMYTTASQGYHSVAEVFAGAALAGGVNLGINAIANRGGRTLIHTVQGIMDDLITRYQGEKPEIDQLDDLVKEAGEALKARNAASAEQAKIRAKQEEEAAANEAKEKRLASRLIQPITQQINGVQQQLMNLNSQLSQMGKQKSKPSAPKTNTPPARPTTPVPISTTPTTTTTTTTNTATTPPSARP